MKKTLSIVLVVIMLLSGVFALSGCGNNSSNDNKNSGKEKKIDGVEISFTHGKGTFTLTVPKKEDGTAKYEFTKEKPEGVSKSGTFYLVTDTALFTFSTSGMTYNTSKDYKEKHGDQKATFDGYLEFINSEDFNKSYLPGCEEFEINGRKSIRYYNRVGGSGDYKYYGYFYFLGVDDIYPGSRAEMVVNYKGEEKPKEVKEFDQETLDIINSLEIK